MRCSVTLYTMKYYKVTTVGCKVAQYEGQQVNALLEQYGLVDAGKGMPDLCLVNTCAVTAKAASKSRQAIRALARQYPSARLVVLGCYASLANDSIRRIPQLALLADHRKGILAALRLFLRENTGNTPPINTCANTNIKTENRQNVKDNLANVQVERFANRHRAILKIQDGCDACCTYCIIPTLRPNLTWRPTDEVLDQARRFIDAGHQEIVLSGVFLGGYGRATTKRSRFAEPGEPLADLVKKILQLPGLGRLRFSSLEPGDCTPRLLDVIAASETVARHLHLPLQSGSDHILKRMARQYTAGQYRQAIERARSRMPDIAFTTDIIAGFPGEEDADFNATLNLAQIAQFSKIHIFPFSPREGTVAYRWRDETPPSQIVKSRLRRLRECERQLALAFRRRFIGKTVRVLVEKVDRRGDNTSCLGRADQYFPVRFDADRKKREDLDNLFVHVRIDAVSLDDLTVTGSLWNGNVRNGEIA